MTATGKLGMVDQQACMQTGTNDPEDHNSTKLSTDGDFHDLLGSFSRMVRSHMYIDGIEYEHEDLNLYFVDGEIASASISYNLTIGEENLGVLRFTRNSEFSVQEVILLENMIAGLVQPLGFVLTTLGGHSRKLADHDRYRKRITMEIERCSRYQKGFSLVKMTPDLAVDGETSNADIDETMANWIFETLDFNSRRIDTVFRTSADEFMLVLPYTNTETASYVARRIQEIIRSGHTGKHDGGEPLTMSVGIASYMDEDDVSSLMGRCDSALSQAKQEGSSSLQVNVCNAETAR